MRTICVKNKFAHGFGLLVIVDVRFATFWMEFVVVGLICESVDELSRNSDINELYSIVRIEPMGESIANWDGRIEMIIEFWWFWQ